MTDIKNVYKEKPRYLEKKLKRKKNNNKVQV